MLMDLDQQELQTVADEIPCFSVDKNLFANGLNIVDLLAERTQILDSKGNARKAIINQAISVNMEKIGNHEAIINHESLLHGRYMMVENVKRNKYILVAE